MTYRRPADIADVWGEESLFLASLPSGPIHVLQGTAALIWEHALDRNTVETVASVADAVGLTPDEVDADTRQFLRELISGRLLAYEQSGQRG